VLDLRSLRFVCATLCLGVLASPLVAQDPDIEGSKLAGEIAAAVQQVADNEGEVSDPFSIKINWCEVRIEYVYSNSCSTSERIASSSETFNLKDIASIRSLMGSSKSLLVFDFKPEISMEVQKLEEIIRLARAGNRYRADNLVAARKIMNSAEVFLEERQMEMRSEVIYCNGASWPSYSSVLGPEVIVDSVEAEFIVGRLEEYRIKHCHPIGAD